VQFLRLSQPSAAPQRRYQQKQINQLCAGDRSAHHWYRFILSFPPHLVQKYVQRFQITPEQCVLDPFCGTGTTIVECKKLGIPAIGVEANPIAHFASQVKVDWSPDPDTLLAHAEEVAESVYAELTTVGLNDDLCFDSLPLLRSLQGDLPPLRTLSTEQQQLLVRNSISPLPLHKTLLLLDRLQQHPSDRTHAHELLALANALVTSISNLHFGPEVSRGQTKVDVPVVRTWLAVVKTMVDDLRDLQRSPVSPKGAIAYCADSRQILNVLPPCSVDAVITSPPYPNEKDYTRATRLESVLLGFIRDKAELRLLKQGLVRSNTRNVYAIDDDDRWIANHVEIHRIGAEIEARRLVLGKTSGFERQYARVTQLYFGGMARHLAELRSVLRPGAQLAYVVGDQASFFQVLIRTGHLLAEIAQSLGYQVVDIELFRTRTASTTGNQLNEEVVLLKWQG
jgi:DNA modification methylase